MRRLMSRLVGTLSTACYEGQVFVRNGLYGLKNMLNLQHCELQ